jgi:hypothetical protein
MLPLLVDFDEAAQLLDAQIQPVTYRTFRSRCPAHLDRVQSLVLTEVEGSRIIATCSAGCAFPEIMREIRRLRRGVRS